MVHIVFNKGGRTTKTLYTQVFEFIDSHRSDILAMWEDFVNTPSQARDREAAMRMAEKLTAVLEETGMTVTAHDAGPVNSCTLEAVWGAERPGQPVLFGHSQFLPGGKSCLRRRQ